MRVHSLLDTATMYGTHTQLTRVAAKVACDGSNASEHKAHGADPAHSWVAVNPQDSPRNPSTERSQDDGILLIVPARLYGHKVQCLVDSGATRCYMSPDIQLAAGINCTASETFLELADGTRVISAGRAPAVLFSIGGNSFRMDFTVTKLLHGVDLVLGMTWLQRVNPLIDWTVPRLLLESEHQLSAVRGQWIASTEAPSTVKVIDDAKWASMRGDDRDLTTNLEILQTPTFWRYAQSSMPWRAKDAGGGGKHGDPHKSPVLGDGDVQPTAADGDGDPVVVAKRKKRRRLRIRTPEERERLPKSKVAAQRVLVSHKQFARILGRSRQTPAFCAIVRPANDDLIADESKGMTALRRQQLSKERGPKHAEDFKSVEEQREAVLEGLPVEQREQLRAILKKHAAVFPDALPKGAPPKREVEHKIDLVEGAVPKSKPPYRLEPKEQDELEKQIASLVDPDFI